MQLITRYVYSKFNRIKYKTTLKNDGFMAKDVNVDGK
jgi:hypothetical protein